MPLMGAALLALGLVLGTAQPTPAKEPVEPDGYLRVFHGVQAAAAVPLTLTLDGRPAGRASWGQSTAWQATEPGRHEVTLTGPGSVATSLAIDVRAGCRTTIFAGQSDSAMAAVRLVPHRDCVKERIPPSRARITTVVATDPDFGPVEFRVAGRTLPLSPYRPAGSLLVPAGESRLVIGAVGTGERFAAATAILAPGTAYTIAWAGGGERAAGTLSVLQDAAQSPKAPPAASVQPINTGMAGSSPWAGLWLPALAIVVAATLVVTRHWLVRSRTFLLVLLVASGSAGCAGRGAPDRDLVPSTTRIGPVTWTPADNRPSSQVPVAARQGAAPRRMRIEALGLDRPVVPLSMEALAGLPRSLALVDVGWLSSSSPIGVPGTTALLGHTDFSGGGAFARLGSIRRGDGIDVIDTNGRTLAYVVRSVIAFPKAEFPAEVWGPQPVSALVLVTCGGPRDPATRLHTDNILVWAVVRT
jgi:sortase (surface protein transpeptidase)